MFKTLKDLNEMIVKDKLTSLYNRRHIEERLPYEISEAENKKLPLSLIFLDADNFKQINDSYGHVIGDVVLKEIAKAIKHSIRTRQDWAARYGGDEFVVLLKNLDSKEASEVIDRMRSTIKKIEVTAPDGRIVRIRVSMGVHTIHGERMTSEELIRITDQKMYSEKVISRIEI
jgi:two-component system cell cycle response regulator